MKSENPMHGLIQLDTMAQLRHYTATSKGFVSRRKKIHTKGASGSKKKGKR